MKYIQDMFPSFFNPYTGPSIQHSVIVVGGGFGGLNACKELLRLCPKGIDLEITLVDKRNYHLFQPLLYQVATGGLSPANICTPLRAIFQDDFRVKVLLAKVIDIDAVKKLVFLSDGEPLRYDSLIISAGASHYYFGKDQWADIAPGLKSLENALTIRRRILLAFEAAERELDEKIQKSHLRFVIVGGGPTGVEMAGAIAEIAHFTLRHEFRAINPSSSEIIIVEASDRVLTTYDEILSQKALKSLKDLNVTIKLRTLVTEVTKDHVSIKNLVDNSEDVIWTKTVIWAAGVKANPLTEMISKATGAELDRSGRVLVRRDCTIESGSAEYPDIYIIGDMAAHYGDDSNGRLGGISGSAKPLPGVAQVAMQQGKYVGHVISHRLKNKRDKKPDRTDTPQFHYYDLGSMAVIGRSSAVASVGIPFTKNTFIKCWGFIAWVSWLFIHLLYIVQFANRVLVAIQWGWNFVEHGRGARLITGEDPFPLVGIKTTRSKIMGEVE